MSVRRDRKSRYQRGTRTYGWGRVGQHRRSGTKGGKGRSGYHKHYWTWVVKYDPNHYGKHGFTRPLSLVRGIKAINIGEIEEKIGEWLKKGFVVKSEEGLKVFIEKAGYNKLLGRGKISLPLTIVAPKFTSVAKEKVEKAGGKVIERDNL